MAADSITVVAAWTLGLTFAVAGINKLRDPAGFALGVIDYQVLSPALARPFARVVPFLEVACAGALLSGVGRTMSASISVALLLSFLLAVSINAFRGRRIECHCFGSSSGDVIGWPTIVRLVALLWIGALVLTAPHTGDPDLLGSAVLTGGILLSLYLLGSVPAIIASWSRTGVPTPTRHGTAVDFRKLPRVGIATALRDKTGDRSKCGACP